MGKKGGGGDEQSITRVDSAIFPPAHELLATRIRPAGMPHSLQSLRNPGETGRRQPRVRMRIEVISPRSLSAGPGGERKVKLQVVLSFPNS